MVNWENKVIEDYEKAIETCKEMITKKNEIIAEQQKELNYYHKYEKTQEQMDAHDEELRFFGAEDLLLALPRPIQWLVKPYFNKQWPNE